MISTAANQTDRRSFARNLIGARPRAILANGPTCRRNRSCATGRARIWPRTATAAQRPEAARIIDETTWGQHVRVKDIPLDIWTRPRATLDFVDLVDAAKALVAALETDDLTAFVEGYSQHDFREFEEAEQPPTWLERYPSSADHNLAAALKIRNTNYPMAGRRAQVWRILAEAKAAGLATSERLRIVRGAPAPGTGEPRDVLRLTWLREPDRTRPTLLLDADASPLISERLWPGSKIVKAQAEPNRTRHPNHRQNAFKRRAAKP